MQTSPIEVIFLLEPRRGMLVNGVLCASLNRGADNFRDLNESWKGNHEEAEQGLEDLDVLI